MGFIVAVDGTAGSGKGTITKIIAEKLNLVSIDTGAMYRCVALECINHGIKYTEIEKIKNVLENINIELKKDDGNQLVFLNGENVTRDIRTPEVDGQVAKFAAIKEVRDKITPIQRKMGENNDIIMEGRDIGTVVFPNADVKIYLDASEEVRAKRRYDENVQNGIDTTYEEVLENVKMRDYNDMHKSYGALKKADDAIVVDSTNLSIEEVVEKIKNIIKDYE